MLVPHSAPLEQELERKLNLAWRCNLRRYQTSGRQGSISRSRRRENLIKERGPGKSKIDMIEDIEEFRAEFDVESLGNLGDRRPLENRKIGIGEVGTADGVATQITKRSRSRHRKGCGVVPFVYLTYNRISAEARIHIRAYRKGV